MHSTACGRPNFNRPYSTQKLRITINCTLLFIVTCIMHIGGGGVKEGGRGWAMGGEI